MGRGEELPFSELSRVESKIVEAEFVFVDVGNMSAAKIAGAHYGHRQVVDRMKVLPRYTG